ncbi:MULTISPECIES: acyltransferase family protein [Legionella]|uniref:Acyltransferase n=1 Tax=Legionella drozanskii LLAP-1 TaxID=1212489 RepID=A0A0W0SY10_9GAMM|nr:MULTISPECIES: acyltransferase family protein [Legionella]KTC88230.1 acyltransferase [Legionella drozanskii LLAP-1]PJE17373.1 MAG: acyltransferase [Legionella sp.]
MTYRSDVDGLRAIAILFVLFFHSGLKLFPSGFIGVDLFFVISGFLITNIIHRSIQNQSFSFLEFYSRRLWRLQPVFICLLLVVTLYALFFYLPDDLVQYVKSARKTSIFTSNSYFAHVTTGYFAAASNQLPLLHTWSLSIEWQCYLMLPIAIYLLNQFVPRQHISKIIYLLTFLFFVLALYFSAHNATKTYYQFLSRIFEFLVGSCVALTPRRFSLPNIVLNIIGALALLTLIFVATRSNISLGFPNYYALILCVATGLLIAIGEHQPKPIISHLLSVKPLVFIGLISYSLYIWHWPIFAFIHYEGIQETTFVTLIAFIFSFVFAYLSWRFIEKPSRKMNRLQFSYSVIFLLILPVAVMHLSAYIIKKNAGLPFRFNEEVVRIYKQLNRYNSSERPLCIGKNNIDINTHCLLGAKNSPSKKGFMIGDSYSNHYWGFMDTLAKDANLSILAQATSSCLTLPGIFLYDWWSFKNEIYQECYEQTSRYFDMIKTNHYDFVIIGQTWKNYLGHSIINQLHDQGSPELTKKRITVALDKALGIITDSGAKPVLIKATASTTENLHDCFFQHVKQRTNYSPGDCDFNLQTSTEFWLNNLFEEMQKKYPQLIVIDPKKVQCLNNRCKADINGVPVFRDIGHITDYASYQFAKLYLKQYKNPLINLKAS